MRRLSSSTTGVKRHKRKSSGNGNSLIRCGAGQPSRAAAYGWERRGRNLIQATMATATSSQGENKTSSSFWKIIEAAAEAIDP